jgi:hypothetical protein
MAFGSPGISSPGVWSKRSTLPTRTALVGLTDGLAKPILLNEEPFGRFSFATAGIN